MFLLLLCLRRIMHIFSVCARLFTVPSFHAWPWSSGSFHNSNFPKWMYFTLFTLFGLFELSEKKPMFNYKETISFETIWSEVGKAWLTFSSNVVLFLFWGLQKIVSVVLKPQQRISKVGGWTWRSSPLLFHFYPIFVELQLFFGSFPS